PRGGRAVTPIDPVADLPRVGRAAQPGGPAAVPGASSGTAAGGNTPAGAGRRRAAGAVPAGSNLIASAMTEDRGRDSLDARIRRLCEDLGLLRYHTHDSRRSPAGYPDLTIVGPRGVLFRELKTQRGKISAEQQRWLDALTAAGQNAAVWRPASLLSGAIAAELTAISAWRVRRGTRCVCDAYGSCPKGCPWCPVCRDEVA